MDFKELDVKSIHDAAVEDCNDSVKKWICIKII